MKPITELKQIAQDAELETTRQTRYIGDISLLKFQATFDPPTVLALLELIELQHDAVRGAYMDDSVVAAFNAYKELFGEKGGE